MKEKNIIFHKSLTIDKKILHPFIRKKFKEFKDITLMKRCNSTKLKIKRREISFNTYFKKFYSNMENKYKKTKNHCIIKKYIEMNGIDENLNYQYLKELKENKDDDFPKEFEQYKYTLSFDKRIELSTNPKDEINIPLKEYFENILLMILDKQDKFNVDIEIAKFDNIDFDKFGILINPKINSELFYCFMLNKFLLYYKYLSEKDGETEDYISLLKDFIKEKDLTPIKCLVLTWIIFSLLDEDNYIVFRLMLSIYNSILRKNESKNIYFLDKTIKNINPKGFYIYNHQVIIEDQKSLIENSYYGKYFYNIYDFFQKVLRSPLLNEVNMSIDEYTNILKEYDYSDITIDKIILFPMLFRLRDDGLMWDNLDYILINSSPYCKYMKINSPLKVVKKIYNFFFLFVTLIRIQGFLYLRSILNKLDSNIDKKIPNNLFLNLTNDKIKLPLIQDGDEGDKLVYLIFGNFHISLKEILYFSNINNYNKSLSQIEKDVAKLKFIETFDEKDINNSFFKNILNDEEKNNLYNGNYDKKDLIPLYITSKTGRLLFIPFTYGRDKK